MATCEDLVHMPSQPVSEEDRAWVASRLDDRIRRAEEGASEANLELARLWRANPRYTDPKHHWDRLIVDDKGFVWLWVPDTAGLPEGSYRFRVLSPEGEYLGETTTPGWPQPQRGNLLMRWEDPASGEAFPAVYRILPAVEGLVY